MANVSSCGMGIVADVESPKYGNRGWGGYETSSESANERTYICLR